MSDLQAAPTGSTHPAAPRTVDAIAADAAACVAAGATLLHLHAYDDDGVETLEADAVARTLLAVRRACPGIPINLTTFAEIEPDPRWRLQLVQGWRVLPDLVAANQGEAGIDEIASTLAERGVAIEACVLSVADVERFVRAGAPERFVRLVVEPLHDDPLAALAAAAEMERLVAEAGIRLPQMHHGMGAGTWAVLRRAVARGHGIRVGLEDVDALEDGTPVASNAELVSAAAAIVRASSER